jgi:uncharacterized protein YciI
MHRSVRSVRRASGYVVLLALQESTGTSLRQIGARGELLMIGPFSDPRQGAMGVFATREAAEAFVPVDPFVLEGVVNKWELREWRETLAS